MNKVEKKRFKSIK